MEADPDAELMLRLKNGEDWILNELMTRWQEPLVGFIYRYIGHQTEALDIAQETFVRVYETRHRYIVRGKFSTWLFAIAANLCRNYLRWRKKRGEPIPETTDTDEVAISESRQTSGESPDQAAIRSETISLIRGAIDQLPHDVRTAILLNEYQSLSYAEISAVLGCSVKAVEMKLYRGRQLLRERLMRSDFR
ncbi:MAG TPA: RNA polymerase sigma factor [Chthoniobacterales bacterium]|jgi:RNA polymerase sigma-70 factor (ECF subfamily)|nr:RNA polymerase sigma factor [Chthoniobacterales bacterium]